MTDAAVIAQLAPTGEIRCAINVANVALVQVDADGGLSGRSIDLAGAIAAALGVPIQFVRYGSAGSVVDAVERDEWDLGFLAVDPKRATKLHFSRPYTRLETTYAVRADSDVASCADLDRPGRRIASCTGAAYDLHLRRTIRAAEIVSRETPAVSRALFLDGGADGVAGLRQALDGFAAENPGVRVLADNLSVVEQAVVTPRERPEAAAFLDRFVAGL